MDLAKSISKLFPDEIRNVAAREIQPTASESVQKHQTPDKLSDSEFGFLLGEGKEQKSKSRAREFARRLDKLLRGFHIWYLCWTLTGERCSVRWPSEVSCFSVNCPTGQCYRFAASGGEGCRIRRETFPNVIVLFSTPIFTYDSKICINNLTKYSKIMTKMFAISKKQTIAT